MASITLKNVPEAVLVGLRAVAEAERRSLNQQAIVLLEEALDKQSPHVSRQVQEQVRAWRELAGQWVSDRSVEAETAGLRSRRVRGRKVGL